MVSHIAKYFTRKKKAPLRSKKLKRVQHGSVSKIEGGSNGEIQDIKTELDTNVLLGKRERESKKELKRLGFVE